MERAGRLGIGLGINLAHEGDTLVATWFTLRPRRSMWLGGNGKTDDDRELCGDAYRTTGPPFNAMPFKPAAVVGAAVGNAIFTFANGNSATFAYSVNGVSQAKTITREVFRARTVCQ